MIDAEDDYANGVAHAIYDFCNRASSSCSPIDTYRALFLLDLRSGNDEIAMTFFTTLRNEYHPYIDLLDVPRYLYKSAANSVSRPELFPLCYGSVQYESSYIIGFERQYPELTAVLARTMASCWIKGNEAGLLLERIEL